MLRGKGSRCVGADNLPPSCADCLEILAASTSYSPKVLHRDFFTLFSVFEWIVIKRMSEPKGQ